MATDKCPKCGAERYPFDSRFPSIVNYTCGSWDGADMANHRQSDACRIRELEAENVELKIQINVLESELENR